MDYHYTVSFVPLPDGGYDVRVPAFPEVCTFGGTIEEARTMAKDAIRCVLESKLADGERVPSDVEAFTEPVVVRL